MENRTDNLYTFWDVYHLGYAAEIEVTNIGDRRVIT